MSTTTTTDRFMAIDPIEEDLGCLTIDMTPWQLISYLQRCMDALFGMTLAADGRSEPSIFKCLQKTYGREHAGLIVKWAIWRHHGRPDGQYLQFTHFTKGRKWWTDMLHAEMQAQLARELEPPRSSGMVSADKLL